MPTVSVGRDRLFQLLGNDYTQEEFEALCFDFGIELDDVTTETAVIRKQNHQDNEEVGEDEEVIYKIEVPANRYDLLCLEGLARALRIYLGKDGIPVYRLSNIKRENLTKIHVKPETALVRPFVVCAILRGITFDEARYDSFIDLQDKLHQNICRKRSLVAIGTHDLDTIQGPFSYEAQSPEQIKFVPLKQVRSFTADELMEYYKTDNKLKAFLHIIKNSPVYPVIYDSNRTVLSLPPIINGAHSAISLQTRNVFIECTATDLTKAKIVLNMMVTMFSEYCQEKFEVEPVAVVHSDGSTSIYPDLSITNMKVDLSDISGSIGVSLPEQEVIHLLKKMQLQTEESLSQSGKSSIIVSIPPTRSDILHPRDVMEDVAIAYGYNNIPKSKPKCLTTGGWQPLNRFSDKIRAEVSRAGYLEVLTWILCSHEENFSMLKRVDAGNAVIIANPRSSEFQVVRNSLMSGLLKTLRHNKDHAKPIKIFEVGDVVIIDESNDVGAANNRRLAALYCNVYSGFEEIMGLVERIMTIVAKPHARSTEHYYEPSNLAEFFPNRQCSIGFKGKKIGNFGIVHPEVLSEFKIQDPCSFLEIDIQSLL
ncbi:phenylalanine--tRNA ligase beta subunit, cytoplasmic [Dioscorea cayenensis subsp. rotundata]|uniref:phenylalanine--tRNA ligase n=1 Tax=Dioscorea cayennensis subsp. rotundata TaxID=55577 RepID=A0AB40AHV7_DIOCR|nr:phenylalanine--tRNA ligase beta subunit, cytoplasmic [Dioscorea cayenensis subsp. rotundata]